MLTRRDLEDARVVLDDAPREGDEAFTASFLERLGDLLRARVEAGYSEFDAARAIMSVHIDVSGPEGTDRHPRSEELFFELVNGGHHPLVAARRRGRFDALKVSDFLTPRALRRGRLFSDWFRLDGVADVLGCGINSDFKDFRTFYFASSRPFTERERALLNVVRPHLARLHAEAETRRRARRALAALESGNAPVVLVGASRRIDHATSAARALLDAWFTCRDECLPAEITDWLVSADPRVREGGSASPRLRIRRGERLLVIEAPVDGVLLLHESVEPPEIARLTTREREILGRVELGETNAEIAGTLGISEATVRTHLHNIFRKLDVTNRTSALARSRNVADAPGG